MSGWCGCGKCGQVFSCLTAFDAHQEKHYNTPTPIVCRDPAEIGLVLNQYQRWSWPPDASSGARTRNLRAERAGV